jgi:hypothetical protein
MKLHVVFDKDGTILGAAQLDVDARIRARPIADEQAGQRAADVYVPADYQHYDLAAVCQRMKVDVKAKFPTLKVRD